MQDDTDRMQLARWQGQIEARLDNSEKDRAGIHAELKTMRVDSDVQHKELLAEIRKIGHDRANAEQVIRMEVALEKRRIDAWENRAEGASWMAKYLPHGATAAVTALVTWLVGGKGPPP